LPEAIAVLDPKETTVIILMMNYVDVISNQALGLNQGQTVEDLTSYLDRVAAAIAADIVPMTGENRVLAYFGLQVINSNPRPGIKALVHQVKNKPRYYR
jgi:single-stranded-DNA-specific exonuclease